LIDLHPRHIIQINATTIAGALIFLSILGTFGATNDRIEALNRTSSLIIALPIIVIFSLSSIAAIDGNNIRATKIMRTGFYTLFIFAMGYFILTLVLAVYQQVIVFPTLFDFTNSTK
jgi:hypothetical protein